LHDVVVCGLVGARTVQWKVPDERLGERVVAAVIPKPGATADPTELSAFAQERLSSQKRPTEWIVRSRGAAPVDPWRRGEEYDGFEYAGLPVAVWITVIRL
jgi:acyl-CoA synthetase (AMP-forming)/AMP-acid ligase II